MTKKQLAVALYASAVAVLLWATWGWMPFRLRADINQLEDRVERLEVKP